MAYGVCPNLVRDGLVLYLDVANPKSYPGSGTAWNDLTGKNGGTLVNGVGYTSDNGGAMVFDGVNDFIDVGINNNLSLNNGGTISIFFKWLSYNGTSWSNTLIGRGGSSWVNHHYILFKHFNTNRLHLSVSDGNNFLGSSGPRSTFDIELDKIYNVTITIDNPLKKMYINGIFNTQVSSAIMPISTPSTVSLGRTGDSIYYLDGYIYNTMIYNRVLSEEEIKQNFNSTRGRFGL
jgi:Neuraminidase (sialidase)